jgi:uncharacterized protein YjbJ (UPF0337 family)
MARVDDRSPMSKESPAPGECGACRLRGVHLELSRWSVCGCSNPPTQQQGPSSFTTNKAHRCLRQSSRALEPSIPLSRFSQVKGKLKQQWGKLTDDDLTVLEGRQDQLAGKIQERYGIAKEDAERQIREFKERNRDLEW